MGDRAVSPSPEGTHRFLLVGGGFANKGAEAMVLTVAGELARRWPGAAVTVASYSDQPDLPFGPVLRREGVSGSFDLVRSGRGWSKLPRIFLLGLPVGDRVRRRLCRTDSFLAALAGADVVLDVSGFALSDQRPLLRRLVYCIEIASARWLGARFVAMTQAFGPFSGVTAVLARLVLPRADLIVARGEASARHLHDLGIDCARASDMAYLFPALDRSRGRRLLEDEGVAAELPTFGLAPNVNLYSRTAGRGADNLYVRGLARLASLAAELGATPVFVCHESRSGGRDDEWLARQAVALSGVEHYAVIGAHHSAAALKSVIGELSLVVASRFHSVVAAISMATPFLSLGWSHKYVELVLEAGEDLAALDGQTTDAEEWCRRAALLWEQRAAMRERLRRVVPRLEESARGAFDLLEERLGAAPRMRSTQGG